MIVMRRRGLEPMHDEHVNVTPLIDVMMCLIIFFLLCGQLAKDESSGQVRIPKADNGQEMPEQRGRLLINLLPREHQDDAATMPLNPDEQPEIWIRGKRVPLSDLTAYLKKEKQETPDVKVILRADEEVTYNWISPVLVSCAAADIRSVNFATKK